MAAQTSQVAIVGGGIMGGDIAILFAAGGWKVHVMSPSQKTRDALPARIAAGLKKLAAPKAAAANVKTYASLEALPWKDMGVDVVVESTGLFTYREGASQHLTAGADKVLISAPASDPDITIVLGVNDDQYDAEQHHIISNASCTTNCVAPMAKVLLDTFGLEAGFMTTIHAYTTEQQLQDQVHMTRKGKADLRRMRSAPQSIIPASTGAAKAIGEVIPELKGKVDGMAMRVPVPDGSVTDLVSVLGGEASAEAVNDAYRTAAESDHWAGILQYTEDPIVSSDIVGNPYSCIIDGLSTMTHGNQAKVIGWYDNEWGYSCRCVDVIDRLL